MANRWEKMETVTHFIILGSKITVDGDCSHEIKRCLLLGRGFPGGSALKNLPAMQELQGTWVWFLGQEDPLEEGMTTHHYSRLENHMDRGSWWAAVHRVTRFGHNWSNLAHIHKRTLLGRKAMTNLTRVLKSRDITFLIKAYKVKAVVFPTVMHRCES